MQGGSQPGGLCISVGTITDEQFTQIDMAKAGCIVQGRTARVGCDSIDLGSTLQQELYSIVVVLR